MNGSSERRQSARFQVTDGAFAFINNIPFLIQNISETGVQLESVVFDGTPADDMMLDIIMQNDNFFLQNIPVRLIRFQKGAPSTPFSRVQSKCLGLQFGELTQQQKTRLEYFLTRCTTSEA